MMEWVAVFVGGGLGSLTRLAMGKLITPAAADFPWATFLTNVAACLVLGLVAGFAAHKGTMSPVLKMGLTAGFCGGFSTFSTFSLESMALWESGKFAVMGTYVAVSVLFCFLGVAAGQWLARVV